MTSIIVSYDGTANEDDAVALGRLFGQAGAEVSLAYVRHTFEPDSAREDIAQHEARALLDRGAQLLGDEHAARHVVTDRSTPEGLAALAEREGADVIVFCSDSHTARGHIAIGNSAQRLLDGGATAIAIAPVGFAQQSEASVQRIVGVGEPGGDGSAQATAQVLAQALGASVVRVADEHADLLVIDSRTEAAPGRVSLSASAAHLIEIATCPVLVTPRGVTLSFGRTAALTA